MASASPATLQEIANDLRRVLEACLAWKRAQSERLCARKLQNDTSLLGEVGAPWPSTYSAFIDSAATCLGRCVELVAAWAGLRLLVGSFTGTAYETEGAGLDSRLARLIASLRPLKLVSSEEDQGFLKAATESTLEIAARAAELLGDMLRTGYTRPALQAQLECMDAALSAAAQAAGSAMLSSSALARMLPDAARLLVASIAAEVRASGQSDRDALDFHNIFRGSRLQALAHFTSTGADDTAGTHQLGRVQTPKHPSFGRLGPARFRWIPVPARHAGAGARAPATVRASGITGGPSPATR